MSIAHDAETRFPTTDGPSGTNSVDTATGDVTFSHVGAAGACGAVVVVVSTGTTAVVTGVLYGGVSMTLSETATDTTETGRIDIYTLVDGVLGGTQTVTLQGASATGKWATCSTVTSTNNSVRLAGNNHTNTTTSTNPTVSVTTDSTALLYGAVAGGAASPGSYVAGTGYTAQFNNDYGAQSARSERRTSSVAAGSITFNFTFGTSDDWCIAAVALAEGAKIAATVAGVGGLSTSGLFPGLTQWVETASKATAAAQTGPSWSVTPDGANAVGLVWTGAISSTLVAVPADLTGTAAGVGAATGTMGPPSGVPVNTAVPVLTGTGVQGQTISLTSGSWSNTPTSFKYWWRRSDVPETIVENTSGSSPNTYVLTADDVGHSISGRVAATNATGTSYYTVALDTVPTSGLVLPSGSITGATAAGTGSLAGAITFTAVLSGTAAGVGAISLHDLASPAPLSGAPAGVGTLTGSLSSGVPAISGTLAGAGAVTGTAITSAPLSGTMAGVGAASGAPTVIKAVTGAPAGVGAVTGALRAMTQIAGTAAGTGSVSGTVVTTPPGITQWAITANRAAGTQLGPAWAITADGPDAQSLVWVGAIAGAAAYLTGSAAGIGAAPAVLSARTFLTGQAAGLGSATGSPAGRAVLAGAAAGVGSAPSALTTTARLSATSAGAGAATATVTTGSGPVISGTVAGVGSLVGGPRAFTLLSGSTAGVGSLTGQPAVIPGLTQWALTASKATISLQTGPSWSASPDGPNAVALVWAGAVRPFSLQPDLSGIAIGSGSMTGALTTPGVVAMTGTCAGVGSVAGALTAPRAAWLTAFARHAPGMLGYSMAFDRAVVAGTGTVTGGLASGAPTLAGAVAGVGGATGALASLPVLSGSVAGVGTLTGTLVLPRLLSGTLSGVGSATGVLAGQVAGSADGSGAATGTLIVAASITALAAGVGSASPSQVTTPGQAILGGAPAGVGALSGALKVTGALAGSVAGSGAVVGSLTAPAVLTGTVDGIGAVAGNVTSTFGVTGAAGGAGAATGAMTVSVQFGGSVNGTGDTAGSFTATAALIETLIGPGSVTGNLTTPGVAALVATADGSGSVSGSPTVPALGAVTGTSTGVGTVVAILGSQIALSGNLLGAGAAGGVVAVPVVLAGTSTGTGHVVAHLRTTRHRRSNPAGVITRSTVGVGTITP